MFKKKISVMGEEQMYQLRIYTLASKEAAKIYCDVQWKRHIISLGKYERTTHNVFTDVEYSDVPHVFAIVSYNGKDMDEQDAKYMKSAEFKEDMEGFDIKNIVGVKSVKMDQVNIF